MSITERAISTADKHVSIIPMTEHDLLEVVEIEESSGLSRWGWGAYYAELQGANRSMMLIARISSESKSERNVAGYIVARVGVDELHINNVAVRDCYRRRGIGRALLQCILAQGREAAVSRAYLELRAGNSPALALYEECGFRVTARRNRYYSDPMEDALVMIANLSESP